MGTRANVAASLEKDSVAATISIAPITPGREPEWDEFIAELKGPRRIDWAQSQRRRGITRQVVSKTVADMAYALVYTEVADSDEAARLLEESSDGFDEWLRDRVADLHGDWIPTEVAFDSAPKPGPWGGLRR